MSVNPHQALEIPANDVLVPLKLKGGKPSCQMVSACLQGLLEVSGAKTGILLTLPSLMQLARHFNTSHLVIHDAFQTLRKQGYDYNLKGMDAPIPFWYMASCDEA
jgi:hypothetical protein